MLFLFPAEQIKAKNNTATPKKMKKRKKKKKEKKKKKSSVPPALHFQTKVVQCTEKSNTTHYSTLLAIYIHLGQFTVYKNLT